MLEGGRALATTNHLPSGFIYVYDIDNAGVLVKTVLVPTTAGVQGAVASVATGNLYIAYGPDQGSGGSQLAYDLITDQPSLSVTPSSVTTTFTVTVSVKTTGLAPGTYTGNVIATIPQESGSPAKLSVTLIVTARRRHR